MNEDKIKQVGTKMQKLGCFLTLVLTIPIVLTLFLGVPGLIIGGIIAIIAIISFLSQKKKTA